MDDIKELIEGVLKGSQIKSVHNGEFSKKDGKMKVYYSGPFWGKEEVVAAVDTLLNGKWLSSGEKVNRFEREFSKKFNMEASVMVNSGSSANLAMIAALKKYFKWEDGAEVIVSPVGFPTTIAPLIQNNLTPVFVDIEEESLNFDLSEIEKKISSKTVGVFLSPVLGNPPDMDKLTSICEERGIKLILDNCDSLGSKWKGKYLNEYAVAASCSFYPAHHITTAEGGMVSGPRDFVNLVRSFAWWGRDCYCVGPANLSTCGSCGKRFDRWLPNYEGEIDHKYVFTNVGYNLKPLDLQGAIGSVQLKKFEEIHAKRRYAKNRLARILGESSFVRIPVELPDAETSWFGTPVVCDQGKASLVAHLEANGIQTRPYFAGNLLMHPGYKHLDDYRKYPKANKVLSNVFFIGASPHYTEEVFDYVDEVLQLWKQKN
jgi:CDP-6-deoxy-D-xylo-4-hexulose-3-dehydrase